MSSIRSGFLAALFCLLLPNVSLAHEGHVHGDEAPPPQVQTAPRITAASPMFELVGVVGNGAITVYLDRFDTNAPVVGAVIDVETPDGPVGAVAQGDTYRIEAPWAAAPGTYELLFTVVADADIDFLTGTLTIPEPVVIVQKVSTTEAAVQRISNVISHAVLARLRALDVAVIAIGGLGFLGGLMVMALWRRKVLAAGIVTTVLVLVVGTSVAMAETTPTTAGSTSGTPVIRDVAQRLPDGRVFAPKATQRILAILTMAAVEAEHRRGIEMPGRVIPDPNTSGFVQTAIGGRLLAPQGGFPVIGAQVAAGDVLAYVEPSLSAADLSAIRQSKAELDQEISLEEREVARLAQLLASGTVSKTQMEGAELTLQGLRNRRASIDTLRMEPEALLAPVSGIVSKANAAPGLIAETNTEVFHIIDPAKLLVEALSFGGAPVAGAASVMAANGGAVGLVFAGAGFAEDGQARQVLFNILDANRLAVGERVTVIAETAAAQTGIVLPRDAVIRGPNGGDLVYVHVAPELFEPRIVRTEPLDGGRVLVVAGVLSGDRVVTVGAELLNQLR